MNFKQVYGKTKGGAFGRELRPNEKKTKKMKKYDPCYQMPVYNKKELNNFVIKPFYLGDDNNEESQSDMATVNNQTMRNKTSFSKGNTIFNPNESINSKWGSNYITVGLNKGHAFGSSNNRFPKCSEACNQGRYKHGVGPGDYYDKHYTIGEKKNYVDRDKKMLGVNNKYAVYNFPRDTNSKLIHAVKTKRDGNKSAFVSSRLQSGNTQRDVSSFGNRSNRLLINGKFDKDTKSRSVDSLEKRSVD